MKVGNFFKNSAFVALATAMVVTALPAQAQDWRGDRGERSQAQRQSPGGGDARRGGWQQRQQPRVEGARPQVSSPTVQRQDWRGGDRNQTYRGPDRRDDRQDRGNWGNDRRGGWQGGRPGGNSNDRPVVRPDQRPGNWQNNRGDDRRYDRRDDRRDWGQRDWRDNQWRDNRGGTVQRGWDRRWRDNRQYDWNGYRSRNRTTFSIGVYASPYRGYTYRRIGLGNQLNSLFYSNRYWISDPWQYRLPPAQGPYRWVRYYDDVMLVDIHNGQVVDVIYDFFW